MIRILQNVAKQYRFNQAFKHAAELRSAGEKELAFNEFKALLTEEPYNPYLRRNLLVLGQELNKEVELPTHNVNPKPTPKV